MSKTVRAIAPLAISAALLASAPPQKTKVVDAIALTRLLSNTGITLQWIGWERRGKLRATYQGGVLRLVGGQLGPNGKLAIEGHVTRIASDRFTFVGRIDIADTPDPGRLCERNGTYEFRITQKRRYWRLQQMEVCDGLTDYVDIYF